jgi:hypothetical protein
MSKNTERVQGVVGVATTNKEKFNVVETLLTRLGFGHVILQRIGVRSGVEEPIVSDPKVVGLGKMGSIAQAVEESEEWKQMGALPDHLLIMDVLAVAKLDELEEEEKVMKKPEKGEVAIDVFTEFFAKCLDTMSEHNEKDVPSPLNELTIAYHLIQAIAPVDHRARRIKTESTRVEYDTLHFVFSRELVRLLADRDRLIEMGNKGTLELDRILGSDTITGFRIQTLLPELVKLAAMEKDDKLDMRVIYERGNFGVEIDKSCDLGRESSQVPTTVTLDGEKNARVGLLEFSYWAVKNVTPWLMTKVFTRRNGGDRRVAK